MSLGWLSPGKHGHAGRLDPPAYELAALFHRAESLSNKDTTSTLARTLHILHVAAALEIGCREFVSFDELQRILAARERLQVLPAIGL